MELAELRWAAQQGAHELQPAAGAAAGALRLRDTQQQQLPAPPTAGLAQQVAAAMQQLQAARSRLQQLDTGGGAALGAGGLPAPAVLGSAVAAGRGLPADAAAGQLLRRELQAYVSSSLMRQVRESLLPQLQQEIAACTAGAALLPQPAVLLQGGKAAQLAEAPSHQVADAAQRATLVRHEGALQGAVKLVTAARPAEELAAVGTGSGEAAAQIVARSSAPATHTLKPSSSSSPAAEKRVQPSALPAADAEKVASAPSAPLSLPARPAAAEAMVPTPASGQQHGSDWGGVAGSAVQAGRKRRRAGASDPPAALGQQQKRQRSEARQAGALSESTAATAPTHKQLPAAPPPAARPTAKGSAVKAARVPNAAGPTGEGLRLPPGPRVKGPEVASAAASAATHKAGSRPPMRSSDAAPSTEVPAQQAQPPHTQRPASVPGQDPGNEPPQPPSQGQLRHPASRPAPAPAAAAPSAPPGLQRAPQAAAAASAPPATGAGPAKAWQERVASRAKRFGMPQQGPAAAAVAQPAPAAAPASAPTSAPASAPASAGGSPASSQAAAAGAGGATERPLSRAFIVESSGGGSPRRTERQGQQERQELGGFIFSEWTLAR